jgi:hypothetical protein
MRLSLRLSFLALAAAVFAAPAYAYNVVNTAWTVNCLYSSSCTIYVTDYSSPVLGNGFLQSRIHQGEPGTTAAGKWCYRYRVDLTQVAGITYPPSVDKIAIYNAGPFRQYDYNGDSVATDQVFVVTSGGIGTVGLSSATYSFGWSYFNFNGAVYAGSYPGNGQSSYFFAFTSDYPPVLRNISVHTDSGWVTVTGYAPDVP